MALWGDLHPPLQLPFRKILNSQQGDRGSTKKKRKLKQGNSAGGGKETENRTTAVLF